MLNQIRAQVLIGLWLYQTLLRPPILVIRRAWSWAQWFASNSNLDPNLGPYSLSGLGLDKVGWAQIWPINGPAYVDYVYFYASKRHYNSHRCFNWGCYYLLYSPVVLESLPIFWKKKKKWLQFHSLHINEIKPLCISALLLFFYCDFRFKAKLNINTLHALNGV